MTVERDLQAAEVSIAGAIDSNVYWFTQDATMANVSSRQYGPESLYQYETGPGSYLTELRPTMVNFSSGLLESYLRDLEWELLSSVPAGDRTLYVYGSTGIDEGVEPNIGDTPVVASTRGISATLVVSDRGVVRAFTASEFHIYRNETVTFRQSYAVEGLGETDATAPAWTTDKLAQFGVSRTANGSTIALRHRGGVVATTPGVFLYTDTAGYQTTVNATVAPGETIYLYLTRNASSNVTLRASTDLSAVNRSIVALPEGRLSVSAYRYIHRSSDTGIVAEVTIHGPGASQRDYNRTTSGASVPLAGG